MAEPAIKRLGTFLADLTQDKPPDQIHQEILERLRDPEQDLDHRLAGIYLHVKDFVPIWTAIRNGVSLPASSWETVVLPVVVHFSRPDNIKPHLESVTSLFLNARGGREIETDPTPAPVFEPESGSLLDAIFDNQFDRQEEIRSPLPPPLPAPAAIAAGRRRNGRRWVPQAAAVAIVAVAAVAIWTGGPPESPSGTNFAGLPKRPPVSVPTEPSASPSAEPQVSGSPVPSSGPTSAAPGAPQPAPPSRVPGAPTGLSANKVDLTSVTLSWRPPVNANTVAYYKIFKDGASVGQPTATVDDVLGLAQGTKYTFVVKAYNSAGEESPPSNSISVTTATPPRVFDVPSSVSFGNSFGVGGSGWQCSDVKIYIGGNAVGIGKVDEFNSFDVWINVQDRHGSPGWVDIIDGDDFQLSAANWPILASCMGGPSESKYLVVIGEPMALPSTGSGSG